MAHHTRYCCQRSLFAATGVEQTLRQWPDLRLAQVSWQDTALRFRYEDQV